MSLWIGRACVLGPPWTDAGADRGHDCALTGAPKLAGGGAKRRGERGELGSGLTGARTALRMLGDDGAEWGGDGAW
jgi:hypothetical protein